MLKKALHYIAHWEEWHWFAKYVPLLPVWLWHCLRSGSLWFFTPSNPTLTFGGFVGETKSEMYKQLPANSYPESLYISPEISFREAENMFLASGLQYPFAAKPDAGMMGFMFRKIDNYEQFLQYHSAMCCDYIIQEFIQYPLEVSVFYYRYPNEQKGTITGFLRKEFLEVTGDGQSDLAELIANCPRAMFRQDEIRAKHYSNLGTVIPKNERYCLSYALNLSRGGKLVNLEHEKDERLLQVFDSISHYTNSFYFGRYDIKCASIEELKNGENFSILEYNGSGAEPHHVYGNGNTLLQAYGILLHHWNVLAKISRQNHKNGVPYWTYSKGAEHSRLAKAHFKKLKELDSKFEFPDLPVTAEMVA